jgi:tetratricopeptide (TPR) repeat protein
MFVLVLLLPCVAAFVPREIALWYLVAAQEERAAGHKDRAYDHLQAAIRWSPKNAGMLLQRAVWRLEDDQTDAALTDVNDAVELQPDEYQVLSIRAQILQLLDRHAEAIQDWKTIDRLSQTRGTPHRATALNGLAYARAVGKLDVDDALKNVTEALELVPKEPAILDTRGYLLHLQGQDEKALPDLDAAVSGMEAALPLQKSQPKGGRSVLSADVDLGSLNTPEQGVAVVRYHRALVLKALGRDKEAEKDLQRARELIGREPDERLF